MLHYNKNSWQLCDLLHLSGQEHELRALCLQSLSRLRKWKRGPYPAENRAYANYKKIEGLFLARQARDAVFFYKIARKMRKSVFTEYLNKLPNYTASNQ